ncbi:MmyB family transcriptional regulator [Streptomyces massasporeus]|uniref:MmyB family transcriptional regulator n=1 Tax=Streptomyces massasporeus TaxID=67324 RepID=UPI0036812DCA
MGDWPEKQRNVVRYVFLHPRARDLFDDWDEQIRACVGRLRALAGIEPDAPDLAQLIDELHSKSPEFTDLWERYDVRWHTHGSKTFHHPEVVVPGGRHSYVYGAGRVPEADAAIEQIGAWVREKAKI